MSNFKNKKVLSALLSLSLAFEPMALAQNNPKTKSEQSLGNKIVQKAKKLVTHPGFYIPVGIVGAGAICLTGKALYNNHKYSKPRQMDGSNTNNKEVKEKYGYNCLNENEKILYDLILTNIEQNKFNTELNNEYRLIINIDLNNTNLTEKQRKNIKKFINDTYESENKFDKMVKVNKALKCDHPKLFWLWFIFIIEICSTDTMKINVTIKSIFQKNEIEKKENELENKVTDILNQMYNKIGKNATDYDKAKYIHDYICKNCTYFHYPKEESDAVKWKVQTAYGCLCEGKAVCEGIARAYQLLMNRAGVECRTIYGAANEDCLVIKLSKVLDSNLNHAWNIIKINGEWRHVDVTWDLPRAWYKKCVLRGGKYGYFLLTNEEIQEDHRIGIPYGNGNDEYINANGHRNFNLPKEIAKDIKVYY